MAADRVHFCKQGFARSIVRYVLYHILNLRRRCKYENRAAGKGGGGQIRHMLEKNWKEA